MTAAQTVDFQLLLVVSRFYNLTPPLSPSKKKSVCHVANYLANLVGCDPAPGTMKAVLKITRDTVTAQWTENQLSRPFLPLDNQIMFVMIRDEM